MNLILIYKRFLSYVKRGKLVEGKMDSQGFEKQEIHVIT